MCAVLSDRYPLLDQAHTAFQFAIGDIIVYGEDKFGEEASQVFDILKRRISPGYLNNFAYASRKIDISRRCEPYDVYDENGELVSHGVPWSSQYEVASLPPARQKFWLDKLKKQPLSRRELQQVLKPEKDALKGKKPSEDKALPEEGQEQVGPVTITIPGEDYMAIKAACEAYNEYNDVIYKPEEFLVFIAGIIGGEGQQGFALAPWAVEALKGIAEREQVETDTQSLTILLERIVDTVHKRTSIKLPKRGEPLG